MIKEIFDSYNIESYNEQFFTNSIDWDKIKIYPFYDLYMLTSKSGSGTCSIKPIAIIFCYLDNNEVLDYYLYYLNSSDKSEELTKKILNQFCSEMSFEIK